ncbi:MAG: arylsulfatase [Opitutus sp.]|nr:arylsulfatase [Opitutus sp.]
MKNVLFALTTFALVALPALPASAATPGKPNIIVILVDDMGVADLGCYGSEILTPNLDRLAADGLRFTQFYNTGRCCPTRASLLTGLYSHQAGIGHMVVDQGAQNPGYRGQLNDSCVTMAEVLRPAGYFTAMTGKWHVGQEHGTVPWKRGFDRSLNAPAGGFYQGGSPRAKLFLNGEAIANDDTRLPKNWYSTDLWTDFGLKFIDEARAARKPFFLYLAHNAPHFPLQAPAEDIAKFRGRYKMGWDKLRAERYARQTAMGLIDPAWALSPRADAVKAWDALSAAEQDHFDHLMAVYAACVHHMDLSVGRLVDGLRQRGELDNTLILFMSDNGGNAESGPNGRSEGDPTEATSNWYCGESWANLENTPFRRFKHYNHEGGIASPLIAHWPAGIKAKGEFRPQPGHLIDIMATCVDVGGAKYPTEFNGKPIVPMEGMSLRPAFLSPAAPVSASPRPLFWEHEGNAAVRVGDRKLVRLGRAGAWELYNLKTDRTELHNVAAAEPARAKELAARWEAWARRAHAIPYPVDNDAAPKSQGRKKARAAAAGEKQRPFRTPRFRRAHVTGCRFTWRRFLNGLTVGRGFTPRLARVCSLPAHESPSHRGPSTRR